jgi:CheY-like chemotaxis protein
MSDLKGRVLVVDDKEMWLEIFTDLLQNLGLEVVTTTTLSEAKKLLVAQYFHLAIIDMRLQGDASKDTQGMDLLDYIDEMGLGDVIVKIVITWHGTRERTREAFKHHDVYDFVPKQGPDGQGFDGEDFTRTIRSAFAEKVRIAAELKMSFVDGTTLDQLALALKQLEKDDESPWMLRWELEDLLRKLFFGASSMVLSQYSKGHSGSGVLKVEPFYKAQGQAAPVIVKYGRISMIQTEACNYEEYVKRFVSGRRYTVLNSYARTKSLGGIVYSFIGAPLEKVQDFNTFYRHHDVETIRAALQDLFVENCRKWYENREAARPHNIADLYWGPAGTDLVSLESNFEHMYKRFEGKEVIDNFPQIERAFVNPMYHDFVREKPLYFPAYLAVTHGDLNGENIFVDHEDHTWLIDFAKTGKGHITRDFVTVESVIKFQLLREKDLSNLYAFERALLAPDQFTDALSPPDISMSSEMEKAFLVIQYLRGLAANVVQPSVGMSDYYAGLFYNALNLMRYYHLLKMKQKKYYILMSAALLCEKLERLSGHNWEVE